MEDKKYMVAFIYNNKVVPQERFSTNSYKVAYAEAIFNMKEDKEIVSSLIFSNRNTAIVIQRKYADKSKSAATHPTYTGTYA